MEERSGTDGVGKRGTGGRGGVNGQDGTDGTTRMDGEGWDDTGRNGRTDCKCRLERRLMSMLLEAVI